MGDLYFNGTALAAGKKVKFNGSDMANVYLNGTKIWTYYIPSAQVFTSSGTYQINAAETSIQYKASGGGGGGGKNQGMNTTPIHGGAGGDTTLSFQKADGTVVHTITASGGAGGNTTLSFQKADGTVVHTITASGGAGGQMGGGSCSTSLNFNIPSGWSNPPWTSTVSDGGRGGGSDSENNQPGCPGDAGGTASGTYTIPTSGDIPTQVVVTIGAGGDGNRGGIPYNSDPGQAGAAWLLGVL